MNEDFCCWVQNQRPVAPQNPHSGIFFCNEVGLIFPVVVGVRFTESAQFIKTC